jgi:hypothetical protein
VNPIVACAQLQNGNLAADNTAQKRRHIMRPYLRYGIAGTLAILMGAAQFAIAQPNATGTAVADSASMLIAWGAIGADLLVLVTLAAFIAAERRGAYQASRFVRPMASGAAEASAKVDAIEEVLAIDATETLVPTSLVTSLTERRVEDRRLRERKQAEKTRVKSTAA